MSKGFSDCCEVAMLTFAEAAPSTSNNNRMVQSLCDGCCNGMCVVPDFDVSFKEYDIKVSKCDRHEA